jgi:hypothetical protein
VAEAVALQLSDYVLANEIACEAARVEERACLNVKRGRSYFLAAPRLHKKNRDEKVNVRKRLEQGCRHKRRRSRGLTSSLAGLVVVRPGRLATIVVLWALAEDDELAPDETRPLQLIEKRSSKPGRTRSISSSSYPCTSRPTSCRPRCWHRCCSGVDTQCARDRNGRRMRGPA